MFIHNFYLNFIFLESFDLLLLFFSIFIFNNFKTATVCTLFILMLLSPIIVYNVLSLYIQ